MDQQPLRILVIDDDRDDYFLTRELLAEIPGKQYRLDWASDYDAGLKALRSREHDVCLLDYRLGARSGLDLLRQARSENCSTATILLTGQDQRELDLAALDAGAIDFLEKRRLDAPLLDRAIRYSLQQKHHVDELQERIAQRTAELQMRNERLALLSEALGSLLSSPDRDQMVRELFAKVASHLGVDTYFNYMIDAAGDGLVLHSCAGISAETAKAIERLQVGEAICGTVAQTREPIIAADIQHSDYEKANLARSLGMQAYVCHPLISDGRLLGTLSFASRTRSGFNIDELEFIKTVSQYVAVAVDRAQAEEKLRQNEQRLDGILRQATVGVAQTDATGRFVSVNDRYCEITGRSRAELLRLRMQDITHPDDLAGNLGLFRRTAETGQDFEIEKRYLRPDGSPVWVHNSVYAVPDLTGAPKHLVAISLDISERKRTEVLEAGQKQVLELIAQDAPLAATLDALVAMLEEQSHQGMIASVLLADAEGRHLRLGAAPSLPEVYNRAIDGIAIGPSVGSCGTAAYRRQPVYVSDIANDPLWAQFVGLALPHNLRACWSMPILASSGELLGTLAMYHREVREPNPYELRLGEAATRIAAIAIERKLAEKALQELNAELEERVRQRTAELVNTIEEREKLQEQLLHAQKMESVGTLASGVAHDFNNLLNIIATQAAVLRLNRRHSPEVHEGAAIIEETVMRGAGLVRQLLSIGKKDERDLTLLELNPIIEKLAILLRETLPKTISVLLDLEPGLMPIAGNENQLNQVLLNLCVNARDAMPEGGRISVKTGMVARADMRRALPNAEAAQYAIIVVKDTGSGMDEATRRRIFEPFFTTKPVGKGTGLGLAVVYGIVQNHGGAIEVESALGQGATFRIYLPVSEEVNRQVSVSAPPRAARQPAARGETILFVEDEKHQLALMQGLLEREGYKVLEAHDGLEAVEKFTAHQERIALAVLDLGLPGIDGWDVFQKLREARPELKVLIASGFISVELESALKQAQVAGVVMKPYQLDDVLHKINTALDH